MVKPQPQPGTEPVHLVDTVHELREEYQRRHHASQKWPSKAVKLIYQRIRTLPSGYVLWNCQASVAVEEDTGQHGL
jgi:hypothetical protein